MNIFFMSTKASSLRAPSALSVIGFLICFAPSQMTHAGGLEDLAAIDFSLRLPAALSKFSSYGDVAGFGGASAGSRYATGINPASTAWISGSEHPFSVSPQYSQIRFERGPTLHISTLALGLETKDMGSFQPAIAQISNDGKQEGDFLLLQGYYAQLQWGKKLANDFAVGLNMNYASFNTKAGLGGALVADGTSDTAGIRGGVLWAAAPRWLTGLVVDYSVADSNANVFDPNCFCLVKTTGKSYSSAVRAGLSYEYAELSSVYLDIWAGRFRNPVESMSGKVIFTGVEHHFLPWMFGRAGVAYDFRGFYSPTLGVGVNPSKNMTIDAAIQQDMFPELRPEFGKSKLLNVSATLSF